MYALLLRMLPKKQLTKQQALQKIRHYCSYQERSHKEVKEKLYSYSLYKKEVEEIISELIESNYLNEERFATQFAGGKFRLKQWGRKKIQYELQQKGVSTYCIKKALKEIDEEEYFKTLLKLTTAKWNNLAHEQYINRQVKTQAYLLQKGFEPALISQAIQQLRTENK
jgi:regulatory protein